MIVIPVFQFKLQPLLNVKEQLEDNLKNKLANALRELEMEESKLSALEKERDDYINEVGKKSSKGVTVSKLKEYSAYIAVLGDRIIAQKENVNCAQNYVDKVREELIKAAQEKEILYKLREKKYQQYLEEERKSEQMLNDEIVSFRHSLTGEENGQ